MNIHDKGFQTGIESALGDAFTFDRAQLSEIDSLRLTQVKELSDLKALPALESLTIRNSVLEDLSGLSAAENLRFLRVIGCRLKDISEISSLDELWICDLQNNLIEDISPLLEVKELHDLRVYGNPLSDRSLAVLAELESRGVEIAAPDEESLGLSRELVNRGIDAVYRKSSNNFILRCLTKAFIEGLEGDESRLAVIAPETLRAELDAGITSCEDLFERYETDHETLRKQKARERTSGKALDRWIDEAGLQEKEAEKLTKYSQRFAEHSFVREDESQLERWARSRGPSWDMQLRRLPKWYVDYRRAVGWPEIDEEPALVVFGDSADSELVGKPFALAPIGARTPGLKSALIDRHHIFPIGWGGENAGWTLGIELGDDGNRKIYAFRAEGAFDWDFDPRENVAFETFGALFDAVEEIRSAADGPVALAQLEDTPPQIDLDVERHCERAEADQAREWVQSADVTDKLRQALLRFIDGFASQTFVREDDTLLDYYEVLNQARLPAWYRKVRRALAYVEIDGRPSSLVFGDWDGWEDRPFLMGPAVVNSDIGRILMHRYKLYPLASSAYHGLVIPISEQRRHVEWYMSDEVGHDGFESVNAFDGLAELFDAVTALKRGDAIVRRDVTTAAG